MKKLTALIVAVLSAATTAFPQSGEPDEANIFYDLYIQDSCLTAWVDLAPFLTPRAVERLLDGIELAIEYQAVVVVPRRFWGDQTVVSRTGTIKLTYRKITGEYVIIDSDSAQTERSLTSEAELVLALSDIEGICLTSVDLLTSDRRHVVVFKVTTISLTDLNLAESPPDSTKSESPVRYLFRQFLLLTDYGRHQVTTRTRPFLLSELEELN
jgi:hypothetical protein